MTTVIPTSACFRIPYQLPCDFLSFERNDFETFFNTQMIVCCVALAKKVSGDINWIYIEVSFIKLFTGWLSRCFQTNMANLKGSKLHLPEQV